MAGCRITGSAGTGTMTTSAGMSGEASTGAKCAADTVRYIAATPAGRMVTMTTATAAMAIMGMGITGTTMDMTMDTTTGTKGGADAVPVMHTKDGICTQK